MNQPDIEWIRPAAERMFGDLVRPDRVHSRVYTDPGIFELEMARIFGRVWVYVGHASEIPNPGDYLVRRIGKTPVIFVHGRDGVRRVLLNRCRHRGAEVAESEAGNARQFTCWYHGWSYDNTGKLIGITQPGGYEDQGVDMTRTGLTEAPRFDSYRGFHFASLAASGRPLMEELGATAASLDIVVEASPVGEIFVDAGHHKTAYRGNWKLVGMDGYHANYVHASVLATWERDPEAGIGSTHRDDPYSDPALSRVRHLGGGHCMLDFYEQRRKHYDRQLQFLKRFEGGADYIEAMHRAYGDERAQFLIATGGDPHVGIYPSLQIINNHIRIITPVAVDYTEVTMLPIRVGGMSDGLTAERLRQHESFYGPCGAGSPDDSEMFERVQRGMQAEIDPWVDLSRGMRRERREANGSTIGLITDEGTQRGQMQRWLELMSAAS
jgi:phenylpropionate dioxygenase-like ring-hydroxylating dioxygenase large terminal subunit